MKSLFAITLFLLGTVFAMGQLNHSGKEKPFVPGEIMIQPKQGYNIQDVVYKCPKYTNIKVVQQLSKHVNIWLLKFDNNNVSHADMHALLRRTGAINFVQNNHYIEERVTMPDDSNIGQQWHHVNTGGGGGTADADIDSDEAWDITTGGVTAMGDTIVVAIVEGGGANYSHPDLIDNFWYNHGEIPNNGQDDDGNGYVDDFEGWNVGGNNDNHQAGGHGTNCMGMTGAKGNNTLGVVGANWDVKMMLVSGFSVNESGVIAAYDYPLTMRKIYNQTNGAQGAFVVATSSSWGIDQADPSNYPAWCAFYDTLGIHGVLSAGATTNSALNVDQTGDMPTACPSNYMISVTATDNSDVRTFSGYGQTTIDVGAPGDNIYTTDGNSGYTNTSGTSFATPLTAGVIGLLYSVPCQSFMSLVKSDPQAGADYVRQVLFDGVDPVSNLTTETVTGGRINSFNSLQLMMNQCSASGCLTPYNLSAYSIIDTAATLTWSGSDNVLGSMLRLRRVGAVQWDSAYVTNDTIVVDTLMACTAYEFQVQNDCDTATSDYSQVFTFTTDGCCEAPTGVSVSNISATSADVSWNTVLAAVSYNARYRMQGAGSWTDLPGATSPINLTGLDSCTYYEFEVQTVCDTGATLYTQTITFKTTGCGACTDNNYCASSGNTQDEFIESVVFNTINNISGDDGGYGDHTAFSTTLDLGGSYTLELTPGYNGGSAFDESFVAWIDYNQDGDFNDAGEMIFDNGGQTTQTMVSGNITIPMTALPGYTRLRVSMQYNGAPANCGALNYGEVEDYCVNILPGSSCMAAYTFNSNVQDVSFTDQSTNAITWFWLFGDGTTSTLQNPNHTFSTNGSYNVCLTITDGANCSDSTCQSVVIQGVGIDNLSTQWTATIFPNPTRNSLTIKINDQKIINDNLTLIVTNSLGQIVHNELIMTGKTVVEMNDLPNGVYFYELTTNNSSSKKGKIIKQ